MLTAFYSDDSHQGVSMAGKHFANTGQILQLGVSVVALIIAGANAYPSIASSNFLAAWPVLFYVLLIVSAGAIGSQIQFPSENFLSIGKSEPFARLPEGRPIRTKAGGTTFKMKIGERKVFGAGTDVLSLELHGIDTTSELGPYADLTLDAFLDIITVGASVKEATDRVLNKRYLVPRSTAPFGRAALIKLSFNEGNIDVDLIRVDYINAHSGEIELTLVRCYGYERL
jgi:hypothetical protein